MTPILRKIARVVLKTILSLVLILLLVFFATSVSPIYDFCEAKPFSGPDIFNPYQEAVYPVQWKRANFHTHTRVKGIMNECECWPAETDAAYRKFGYDIVTFSNHNALTTHPYDSSLQVNVYEHGFNLFKYHKLVFGCSKVLYFDHLIPLFASQKQFQLDLLGKDADFIQMNHPLRTIGTSKNLMQKLGGYRIMELDSGKDTENEYWDWALSAGHYSFGLANDDLHFPHKSNRIAIRCNFLNCASAKYDDLKKTLLRGCYYSMRIPDYGHGDWDLKYAQNKKLPTVERIGLDGETLYISLSQQADSIKVTGQKHSTLYLVRDTTQARYTLKAEDPYARITAYFPNGEVIYSNPFARYDSTVSESPYATPTHRLNIPLTILFNFILLALCAGVVLTFYKTVLRCSNSLKKIPTSRV